MIIVIIAFILLLVFGAWWIEMLLWNNVLADVFTSIPEVSYWEMVGISILAWMLFGQKSYSNNKD